MIGSLEYSQAQTAATDVDARDGIGLMTTPELTAERRLLEERLGRDQQKRGKIQRLTASRADAERLADDSASTALKAQAHERARELAAREGELLRDLGTASSVEDTVRLNAVREELNRRGRGSVRAAVVARPEYLVSELGPYPHRRSKRRAWQRAAMRIEGYRHEFAVTDSKRALGEAPRDLRQRAAAREVQREIDAARSHLGLQVDRRAARGHSLA